MMTKRMSGQKISCIRSDADPEVEHWRSANVRSDEVTVLTHNGAVAEKVVAATN
jgi:hypothetical protein